MDVTTRRRMDALDETFTDTKKLIYKTCHEFRMKYGGDPLELFSYAQEIYIAAYDRYDESHGATFVTWLRKLIWFKLFDRMRQDLQRHKRLERWGTEVYLPSVGKVVPEFDVTEYGNTMSLSRDARVVVELVATDPSIPSQPKPAKRALRKHLKQQGWSDNRIEITFREITKAIND